MICTWQPKVGITLTNPPVCEKCGHNIVFHEGMLSCLACRLDTFLTEQGVHA